MGPTVEPAERVLIRLVIAITLVGSLFAFAYLGALHSPEPNDIDLGVVGSPAQRTAVADALEAGTGAEAFKVSGYATGDEARDAVMDRDIVAAVVVSDQSWELLVAGAGGAMAKSNIEQVGASVASAHQADLVVTDLAPLPADDRAGLSPFLLVVSILIPSVLMGVIFSVIASGSPGRAKLSAAAVAGALLGAINTLVADMVYGALNGHYWELSAFATLVSWAISLPIIAAHRLVGPPGIGLVALLFMVVGVPATGAAIGPDYIPDFFQYLTFVFPAGEAIPAVRNIVYFNSADVGLSIALLSMWAGASAVILAVTPQNTAARSEARASA